MSRHAPPINLSSRQRLVLERLSRSRTIPRRLAERVAFVLWSAAGKTCVMQAGLMRVDPQRSRRWRKRWFEARTRLANAEVSTRGLHELRHRSRVPRCSGADHRGRQSARARPRPDDLQVRWWARASGLRDRAQAARSRLQGSGCRRQDSDDPLQRGRLRAVAGATWLLPFDRPALLDHRVEPGACAKPPRSRDLTPVL